MAPQDSFIDDEDDTCPLCVEEFDLSDRSFRPCPCGYQICQFCFNNIKQNMNGLCPACRRPYDEKTIQWKVVTQEEYADFRANIQKNQKKRAAEQRQKEVQKREAEKENRKNLVGVRVVQKNLVYVTNLMPTGREDELLKSLRKPEFFGQYGNIQKISISNRKNTDGQYPSLGVYVTFDKKEDAQRCIQAVNGSANGDRVLKAQLGTTKYCSAWLRYEQCSNRQCMFLHELGDEEDSYTRQDLSSMNSIDRQRPLPNPGPSSRSASRQQMQPPPPPPPPVSHAMAISSSKDGSENGNGSGLPPTSNWAHNVQVRSRRGSHATSGAASSPAISHSLPATAETVPENESAVQDESVVRAESKSREGTQPSSQAQKHPVDVLLTSLLKTLNLCPADIFKSIDPANLDSFPPLFDLNGGERRRAMREEEDQRLHVEEEDEEAVEEEEEELEVVDIPDVPEDQLEAGGSLALGGEPEDRDAAHDSGVYEQRRGSAQPPIQRNANEGAFGATSVNYAPGSGLGSIGSRTVTPQQQTPFSRAQGGFAEQMSSSMTSTQQTSLFQGQGHNRQSSRFNFASDSAPSSTSVKVASNPRIMAQQAAMMPPSLHTQHSNPYFASSMPGPPPGIKSAGTPPAMFGQGGFGAPKESSNNNNNSQFLQEFLRGRSGASGQAHEAGKREYMLSSFSNQYPLSSSSSSTPAPAPGFSASLYSGAFQDMGFKQKKNKGKKHRHANTSSSGGGGLVDLVDPSILRLQHQQSNAGAGQGLFGGQGQGGYNNSNMMFSGGYPARW